MKAYRISYSGGLGKLLLAEGLHAVPREPAAGLVVAMEENMEVPVFIVHDCSLVDGLHVAKERVLHLLHLEELVAHVLVGLDKRAVVQGVMPANPVAVGAIAMEAVKWHVCVCVRGTGFVGGRSGARLGVL